MDSIWYHFTNPRNVFLEICIIKMIALPRTELLCYYHFSPGLTDSAWPGGDYALLKPTAGCPESIYHGWSSGYVKFSMSSALSIRRYSTSVLENKSETLLHDVGSNLMGPFKKYSFNLNFCLKRAYQSSQREMIWPKGNYSIFGTSTGCPQGR